MGQTYRLRKGAPLTFSEADSNWMFPFIWDVGYQYQTNMIVFDGSDFFYLCVQDVTTINTVALNNTAYWKRLAGVTSTSFAALSDVVLTSLKVGQIPRYNGSAWVNSDSLVTQTYSQLSILRSGSNLIPGTFYKFSFQTKHQIDGTSVIHTGTSEDLILLATDVNAFHEVAYSVQNNTDVIYYNFTNVLCEDGTTSRNGKIDRRIDTVNSIDVPFDFRNVFSRRFNISDSISNWSSSTTYTAGTKVIFGGSIYACLKNHTSGGTFAGDNNSFGYWIKLVYNYLSNKYQFSKDSTNFGLYTFTINTSDFTDSLSISGSCVNVKVQIGAVPYGDLSIISSKNVQISDNCQQITINTSTDITISSGSDKVLVSALCENNFVAADCHGITFLNTASGNRLGFGTFNTLLSESAGNNTTESSVSGVCIGMNSRSNYIRSLSGDIHIGNSCNRNTLLCSTATLYFQACHNEVSREILPISSSNITIYEACTYNNIFNSINVTINTTSADNKIINSTNTTLGQNCMSNTIINSPGITLGDNDEFNFISECSSITMESGVTYARLTDDCENITVRSQTRSVSFVNCKVISFPSGKYTQFSTYNALSNKTFSDNIIGVSFLVGNNSTQTISGAYSNVVVNKLSPDGNMWYDTVDNLGQITTNKIV